MKRVLTGATLRDASQGLNQTADLWVADGVIQAVAEAPPDADDYVSIDLTGCWICPGLVDLSAGVLNNPDSELAAAAAGGISHLVCPPDPHHHLDSPAQIRDQIRDQAHAESAAMDPAVRVHLLGALTRNQAGEQLTDQAALQAAGCVGLSDGGVTPADSKVLRSALQYAQSLDLTVFLQPQDAGLADGCAHDGAIATRLGLAGIPESAETVGMARILALVAETGARVHLTRLSSAAGVDMLDRARQRGLPVTADVAMYQLFLTETDLLGYNPNCHVYPPLRTTGDRDALIRAVAQGVIDAVCSHHIALPDDAKLAPFADTEAGISGLETFFNLGLRLVDDKQLTFERLQQVTVTAPAAIIGQPAPAIAPMQNADLLVFDPDHAWSPLDGRWHSSGRNTPLGEWDFQGRIKVLHPTAPGVEAS